MKRPVGPKRLSPASALRATVFAVALLCAPAAAPLADPGDLTEIFLETPGRGEMLELEALAGEGDPAAQFLVGSMYVTGRGVERNLARGAELIQKAADQGNPRAQGMLGAMYDFGHGVPTDREKAAHWYLKAARQGLPQAQFNLAGLYEAAGSPEDYAAAVRWYRAAAETGMTPAQVNLGILFFEGKGVDRDPVETYKWWGIAARLGDAVAARGVSALARNMHPEDLEEARRWIDAWRPKRSAPSD